MGPDILMLTLGIIGTPFYASYKILEQALIGRNIIPETLHDGRKKYTV